MLKRKIQKEKRFDLKGMLDVPTCMYTFGILSSYLREKSELLHASLAYSYFCAQYFSTRGPKL